MLMQARTGQPADTRRRPPGRGRGGERAIRARGRLPALTVAARLLAAVDSTMRFASPATLRREENLTRWA